MKISRTPLRLSLVGGPTDVPTFYNQVIGGVVSMAINKYVYAAVNRKFDNRIRASYSKTENVDSVYELENDIIREAMEFHSRDRGYEVVTMADIPGEGTGLGSSSALMVGLCNLFSNYHRPQEIAEIAFMLESEKCGKSVGKQDHYASAFGGLNYFSFSNTGVEVNPIQPLPEFEKYLLLLWTGKTRSATKILKEQSGNFNDTEFVEIGRQLSVLATLMYGTIRSALSMEKIGDYLTQGWELKKKLAVDITDQEIDDWYKKGMENGAWGGKLCGAGGGGFLLFVAPPDAHKGISKATGLKKIDFKIENEGSKIIYGS